MARRTPAALAPVDAQAVVIDPESSLDTREFQTILDWVALYVPAYGTSLLLHMAVGLLAWFLSWQVQPVVADTHFNNQPRHVVMVPKIPIQPPQQDKKPMVRLEDKDKPKAAPGKRGAPGEKSAQPSAGNGLLRPGPSGPLKDPTLDPFPGDVATHNLQPVDPIGLGSGGLRASGLLGAGKGRANFFGTGGDGGEEGGDGDGGGLRKIVYVVDHSGSMSDSLEYVKRELQRSIEELNEEWEFHVIFYSSGPPIEMPSRRLVYADERNKLMAFTFIDGVIAEGETDPSKALERAFACQPEMIYLLTDGEFDRSVVDKVRRLNAGAKVTVNTIAFIYRNGEEILKQIARENGGDYRFVSEQEAGMPAGRR
jgi:hypothetical protein